MILDGYNLLLTSGRGAGEDARAQLVREAARYRGGREVEVVVVFDSRTGGGIAPGPPGVRVEFAHGDADTAILAMLAKSRSPRDILVVTSDRRLAEQARDLGAKTEDGSAFLGRAARRQAPRPAGEKPGGPVSAAEVEEWMRRFEEKPGDDEW